MRKSQLLTAALLLAAPTTHAAVVASNLSEANEASILVRSDATGSVAQMFTTPTSGPGWSLDSLTLVLQENGSAPGSLTVSLYSNASGLPGVSLGTLTGSSPSGFSFMDYTFTATSIDLAPNTSYFALLTADRSGTINENGYGWRTTSSTSETGEPGWSIADNSLSGSSYADSFEPMKISISATPVPEPSSLVLLGLSGLTLLRRRR